MKIKPSSHYFLLLSSLPTIGLAAALGIVLAINHAHATSATWTGAVDGTWSNVNNWSGPPASVPGAGETATFNSSSPTGIMDLGGGVSVGIIRFETAPSLTIGAGAVNSQTLGLTGTGDVFNGSGSAAGTTLTINAALSVTGTSPRFLGISQPTVNIAGSLTTSAASGTTMLRMNDGGISLNGVVSDGATALMGLQLQQNSFNLNNANNSFTGGILLENATANITTISTTGNNSAIGAGGTIGLGNGFGFGTLNYTGTGGSVGTTNRTVNLANGRFGGRIIQAGTGLLKFEGDVTATNGNTGAPILQLQGSTAGTGEISGSIKNDPAAAAIGTTTVRTAANAGATSIVPDSVDGIVAGANITGSRIQAGTTITAVDSLAKTITLSLATSGGTLAQNTALTIDGVFNPTHVAKSGSGTWVLSGDNSYTGTTSVGGGLLEINGSGRLGGGNYASAISISNTSSGTLKFNSTANQVLGGVISGTGALVKDNIGTLTLTNTNTYEGATTVSGGTLLIDGSTHASSAVTVNGGAIGGTGSILSTLSLSAGSFHVVDLMDALVVAGTVSIYSGFGVDNLVGLDWSTVDAGTYTLINGTLGTGVFDGLDHNNLATAYDAGSGRTAYFKQGSLELVVDVIPEPSVALLGGLGLLTLLRRRRA